MRSNEDWLRDTYRQELGREVKKEGLDYWTGNLSSGQTRDQVLANIRRSDEYKNKQGSQSDEDWVRDTYRTELGREAKKEGLDYWTKDLSSGQNRDQVLANIRRSDEYANRQSAKDRAEERLKEQYRYSAGREASEEELSGWRDSLNKGETKDVETALKTIRDFNFNEGDVNQAEIDRQLTEAYKKRGVDVTQEELAGWRQSFDKGETEYQKDNPYSKIRGQGPGATANIGIAKDTIRDFDFGDRNKQVQQDVAPTTTKPVTSTPTVRNDDLGYWGGFDRTLPEYEARTAVDAAASAGNRMTDDYYMRFIPNLKRSVDLGTQEIGAAMRYHQDRANFVVPDVEDFEKIYAKYRRDITGEEAPAETAVEKEIKNEIKEIEETEPINTDLDLGKRYEKKFEEFIDTNIDKGTDETVNPVTTVSDEQFLKDAYKTLLKRDPDQAGYDYWLDELSKGQSRDDVLANFRRSEEYKNLI